MTKTLTEKWKDRELKEGDYYCKITESPYIEKVHLPCLGDVEFMIEVLAPVPSYDKVKEMSQKIERLEFDNEVLDNELKELATKNDTFAMENGRLQKRLEIAAKALKDVSLSLWDEMECRSCAKQALKEMEGVK